MKAMKNTALKLFVIGLRQVLRDGMLFAMLPAPFLMGALFKFGVPPLDAILTRQFHFTLQPWYGFIDALLLYMAPMFLGMVSAFMLLEERDEGIIDFYNISPAGGLPYLTARLGIPMLWAFVCSLLVGTIFTLTNISFIVLIISSLVSTASGILLTLGISHFAKNRVEGLALSKLSGLSLLGLIAVWFVPAPYERIFAFLPSYWLGLLLK